MWKENVFIVQLAKLNIYCKHKKYHNNHTNIIKMLLIYFKQQLMSNLILIVLYSHIFLSCVTYLSNKRSFSQKIR